MYKNKKEAQRNELLNKSYTGIIQTNLNKSQSLGITDGISLLKRYWGAC